MPVRIYEISKKFGLENKEVLTHAKALGIAAAKVPSSSLDRITADYLEDQILLMRPDIGAKLKAATPLNIQQSQPKKDQPQPIPAENGFLSDNSLAIRLRGDTSVEIYTFSEAGFQRVGNFAFQIDPESNATALKQITNPEEIILLTNNESSTLEFKPSARWDVYQNKLNDELKKGICKAVAAFLNTEGGNLLIGVADNGRVIGLKDDFTTLQKPKADDFLQFIHSLLFDVLGDDLGSCIKPTIVKIGDKDICHISVRPSARPVYVKSGPADAFFIRAGNSSKNLPLKAVVDYCKSRWE